MSYHHKLARHEALMTRMASQNEADLPLAEAVGLISPEDLFEAVQSCTGCAGVSACEEVLETGEPGLPDYCRNASMIRRIAADMRDLGLADD